MAGKLQSEIKQVRPFASVEQEAFLNVLRTADALMRGLEELLKPANLSATQYNVLRILRGAGEQGLACREVGCRMISRDPDITRLMDRLEQRGLITRQRQTDDRRVVCSRITAAGQKVLKALDASVIDLHRRQLGHLGPGKLRKLADLLELARAGHEP